jgi:transposase
MLAAQGHPSHPAQGQPQGTASVRFRAERNLVERFFHVLKHFRALATRCDGLARNFLADVQPAVTIFLN